MSNGKWTTLLLAVLLAAGLTACGKDRMDDKMNGGGESTNMETSKDSGMMKDDGKTDEGKMDDGKMDDGKMDQGK